MMNIIEEFNLNQLNNGSHFNFVSQVLVNAEACTAVGTKASTYLAKFKAAVEAEDKVLKLTTKSLLTDAITQADASRDSLYLGMKNYIKAFLNSLDAELAGAAVVLNQLLIDYHIDTRATMTKETGLMTNLKQDLTTKYKEQVEKLSLGLIVEQMSAANDRVFTLMDERAKERQYGKTGELKAARAVTDEAYHELVRMVNGLVYVEGEAAYLEFVNYINSNIVYYRRIVLGQKAKASADGGSTPGTGDDTGDSDTGGSENPGGSTGGSGTGGSGTPGTGGSGDDDFS